MEPDERPEFGAYLASALELGMLWMFSSGGYIYGILLWAAYYWFSATRYLLEYLYRAASDRE